MLLIRVSLNVLYFLIRYSSIKMFNIISSFRWRSKQQQQCVSPKMSADKQDDLNNQQFTEFSKGFIILKLKFKELNN